MNYATIPTVFAVEDTYQIAVKNEPKTVMWIKIGDKCFYDASNGILKSDVGIHKITVPADLLDSYGSYKVCTREMKERKPYFSETGEIQEQTYSFRAVKGDVIRAYHIADAHNKTDEPVRAAKTYGDIDFLILNGDIPDDSGNVKNFDNIYEMCGRITNGNIPVVFSRGNHDMRGIYAEKLEEYTPQSCGKSYFTVKLGGFWGIVLDCAEDKEDNCPEYGNTICSHSFRCEETEFIEKVIAENKYSDGDIFARAVIVHSPFTQKFEPPFDIENEIYDKWTQLLNDGIKPDIMICGHTHKIEIDKAENSYRNANFDVVTAAETDYKGYFAGAGFEFCKNGAITITVTDSDGNARKIY